MKNLKKLVAVLLVAVMAVNLVACGGGNGNGGQGEGPKAAKIGVALYQDSGAAVTAVKAFLENLSETLNVTYAYTVLSQNDQTINVTKIQELIAAGCDGIICTMDSSTEQVLKECQDANVYLAGYLCDYDDSFRNNYDAVYKNPYFLGTVADGPCGDDQRRGYDFFDSLMEYNEAHPDDPVTHVACTIFPAFAFPAQQLYVEQFTEKINEYNQTATTPIEVDAFNEETDVLMFQPMDSTYFSKHPGIDGIMSFCSGSFVYPTVVSTGQDVKIFASGYSDGDNEAFGSKGPFQQEMVCAVESIVYPLVLLLNKINGTDFSDMPAEAERRSCSTLIINSDEDLAKFEGSIYLTGNPEDAFFTPEDVLNLTAFGNPEATYAGLVETLNHMTIEDIK